MDFVDEEVIFSFIKSAKLLIMPSIYEGFGMPIAEARSLGTPILATDIPEHRESAEGDGVFFEIQNLKNVLKNYLIDSSSHSLSAKPNYLPTIEIAKIMLSTFDINVNN